MKQALNLAGMLFTLLLSGCAYMGDSNKISTPRAENIAPLRTTPGTAITFNTLYPIPVRNYPEVRQVNITPPGLYVSQNSATLPNTSGEVPKRS